MRLSIILHSESGIQIKIPWTKTALMFSNTFLRPACQIQQLGQGPQASNHDALTKPLASVLHVKGSANVMYKVQLVFRVKPADKQFTYHTKTSGMFSVLSNGQRLVRFRHKNYFLLLLGNRKRSLSSVTINALSLVTVRNRTRTLFSVG